MARRGVLIKGGAFLEEVGKLKALAVDKTGTITEGKPKVHEVIPWAGTGEAQVLAIAAGIDIHSEHPLAKAIVTAVDKRMDVLYVPFQWQPIMFVVRHIPERVFKKLNL